MNFREKFNNRTNQLSNFEKLLIMHLKDFQTILEHNIEIIMDLGNQLRINKKNHINIIKTLFNLHSSSENFISYIKLNLFDDIVDKVDIYISDNIFEEINIDYILYHIKNIIDDDILTNYLKIDLIDKFFKIVEFIIMFINYSQKYEFIQDKKFNITERSKTIEYLKTEPYFIKAIQNMRKLEMEDYTYIVEIIESPFVIGTIVRLDCIDNNIIKNFIKENINAFTNPTIEKLYTNGYIGK